MIIYLFLQDMLCMKVDEFLTHTDVLLRGGKIEECESLYTNNYTAFSEYAVVRKRYCNFLYQIGEYNNLINIFGNETIEEIKKMVEKANDNIEREKSFNKNKDYLLKESKYSKRLLIKEIKMYLKDRLIANSFITVLKAHEYFPSDKNILELLAQIQMIRGDYSMGIKYFSNNKTLYQKLKKAVEMNNNINYMDIEVRRNFIYLHTAVKEIKEYYDRDRYTPSIFSKLLTDNIYKLLTVSVKNNIQDIAEWAEILVDIRNEERDKRLFLEALLVDKNYDRLEKELDRTDIKDINFINEMRGKLVEIKKRKEKERQKNRRSGQNADPEGYYKILNVEPTATTKEILKSYRKILVTVDPDNYEGDDPKEKERLEQEMMKINKAKDVLTNEKKREEYDSGRASMFGGQGYQGSYQYGGNDLQDIFSMFFNGGGQAFFSSGGGGYRRTVYFG